MQQASNLKQIEKELVADIFVNRNKVITQALFNTSIFHGYNDLLIGELIYKDAITRKTITNNELNTLVKIRCRLGEACDYAK